MRKHPRYAVTWKIIIVYNKMGKQLSAHGTICDLSLGGLNIVMDHNIYSSEPVVVTIQIPGDNTGRVIRVVGGKCQILHSILSSDYGLYKIGMKFLEFNGKSKGTLLDALAGRIVISTRQPYKEKTVGAPN